MCERCGGVGVLEGPGFEEAEGYGIDGWDERGGRGSGCPDWVETVQPAVLDGVIPRLETIGVEK